MIGIYKITNLVNNKFYIGSSCNLRIRKNTHFCKLRNNKHQNPHLQYAFSLYKESSFIFETIEECEKEKLIEREQYYIDILKPDYNFCVNAKNWLGTKRGKMSQDHKEKLSKAHLGNKLSNTHKNNISISLKGKNIGINNGNVKINQYIANEIRQEWNKNKISHQKLANMFNISRVLVSLIINNKVWVKQYD